MDYKDRIENLESKLFNGIIDYDIPDRARKMRSKINRIKCRTRFYSDW